MSCKCHRECPVHRASPWVLNLFGDITFLFKTSCHTRHLTWVSSFSFQQKDLLLSEIPNSTASLCSRKTGLGKEVAKEICRKHVERRAGLLPEACAEAWATVVCLCLQRRKVSLEEVSSLLPTALPRETHILVM